MLHTFCTPTFWILARENDVKWSHSVLSVKHTRLHQSSSIIVRCGIEPTSANSARSMMSWILKEKLRHELNKNVKKKHSCIMCPNQHYIAIVNIISQLCVC